MSANLQFLERSDRYCGQSLMRLLMYGLVWLMYVHVWPHSYSFQRNRAQYKLNQLSQTDAQSSFWLLHLVSQLLLIGFEPFSVSSCSSQIFLLEGGFLWQVLLLFAVLNVFQVDCFYTTQYFVDLVSKRDTVLWSICENLGDEQHTPCKYELGIC